MLTETGNWFLNPNLIQLGTSHNGWSLTSYLKSYEQPLVLPQEPQR